MKVSMSSCTVVTVLQSGANRVHCAEPCTVQKPTPGLPLKKSGREEGTMAGEVPTVTLPAIESDLLARFLCMRE